MAQNPLQAYGIKEVADVTFYEINPDGSRGNPVLFLDTLKVSSIEQTAESVSAEGGKGNAKLITWDYGKAITVNLEDALFSAKSLSMMFSGGVLKDLAEVGGKIVKTVRFVGQTPPTTWVGIGGKTHEITDATYSTVSGDPIETAEMTEGTPYYATFEVDAIGNVIEVSANVFPGTYYVIGDTFARSRATGQDEFFQFIIYKAKMQAENTLSLEAAGDPSVFNLTLEVLRPDDGVMMRLVQYNVE